MFHPKASFDDYKVDLKVTFFFVCLSELTTAEKKSFHGDHH